MAAKTAPRQQERRGAKNGGAMGVSRVVAWDGGTRYLVSLDGPWERVKASLDAQGYVIDTKRKARTLVTYLHPIVQRGPWHPYSGTKEQEDGILAVAG